MSESPVTSTPASPRAAKVHHHLISARQSEMDEQRRKNARMQRRAQKREAELIRRLQALERGRTKGGATPRRNSTFLREAELKESVDRLHAAAEEVWAKHAEMRRQAIAMAERDKIGHGRLSMRVEQDVVFRMYNADVRKRSDRRAGAALRAIRRIEAEQLCKLSAIDPVHKTQMLQHRVTRWGGTEPALEPTRLRMLGKKVLDVSDDEWALICERCVAARPLLHRSPSSAHTTHTHTYISPDHHRPSSPRDAATRRHAGSASCRAIRSRGA